MKRILCCLSQSALVAVLAASLVTMTACTTDQVLSDIDVALQTAASLETALGAVSPADAAILQLLTGIATTGLNVIQTDYDEWSKNPGTTTLQKIQNAIAVLRSNLAAEFSALHISDPNVVQRVTAWVNLLTSILGAILSAVGGGVTTPAMTRVDLVLPSPELLAARWQSEVCSGDQACGALVKARHVSGRRWWGGKK